MSIKDIFKTIMETLFRWFPFETETGLKVFGNPDENSPVFVTCNFDLTVRRVEEYLKDMDCYLLVVPTKGINVWCSSCGGFFNAHSIISVIKTSKIGEKVKHRRLILPQLSAPGIDTELIRKETGWRCEFGPVYAKDIPEYIKSEFKKSGAMRRVKFNLKDRLEMMLGYSPVIMLIGALLFILKPAWLYDFLVLGLSLLFLMFMTYPYIPGGTGYLKILSSEVILIAGFLLYRVILNGDPWNLQSRFIGATVLVLLIGFDFGGVSPLYRSDWEIYLTKIGINRLGPFSLKKAEKITLNEKKCAGCGTCYDVCPKGVYAIDEAEHKSERVKPSECVVCKACVVQCPAKAISPEES